MPTTPNCFDNNGNPIIPIADPSNPNFENNDNEGTTNSINGPETPIPPAEDQIDATQPFVSSVFSFSRNTPATTYDTGFFNVRGTYVSHIIMGQTIFSGTSLTGLTSTGYLDGLFYCDIEIYDSSSITIPLIRDKKLFRINGSKLYSFSLNYVMTTKPRKIIQKISDTTNLSSITYISTSININGFGL